MKFSAVLFSAALIAGVAAQSTKTTTSEVPVNTNSSYGPEVDKCLTDCSKQDINCSATCLGNPNPTEEQVIETTKCAAECKQGDGSEEQTKAYGDCQWACTVKYFLPNPDNVPSKTTTGTSGPVATDDEGNPVSTDNGTSTETSTESPTASDDSSAASSTIYSTSFAGVVAAFAAFFAL